MVEKINIALGLTGDAEVNQKLAGVEQAGVKTFTNIAKSADQLGFDRATAQISKLGSTMEQALNGAAAAAQKFGASNADLERVTRSILTLGQQAKDGNVTFSTLAASFDKANTSTRSASEGFEKTAAQLAKLEKAAAAASKQMIKGMSGAGKEAAQSAAANKELLAGMTAAGQAAAASKQVEGLVAQFTRLFGAVVGLRAAGAAVAEMSPKLSEARGEAEKLAAQFLRLGAASTGLGAISTIARSLGGFGLAAAGAAALVAGLFKITEAAAASAKAITDLASATGESVQNIQNLQGAFSNAGVSTQDFQKGFAGLTQRILSDGPKLAQEAQQTAGRIIDAELKVQAAYTNAGKTRQDLARLGVAENRAREDAAKSDQNFAEKRIENIRSIEDAETRLKRLRLEAAAASGAISQREAADQAKALENQARRAAIEKAKLDLDKARRQQEEDDQRQAREQEDRAQQAEDRAERRRDLQRREVADQRNITEALQKQREQQANDINKFIGLFQQAAQGVQTSTEGMNTTVENFSKGIVASLAQAGVSVTEFQRGATDGLGNPQVRAAVLQLADSLHTMAGSADELKVKAALLGLGLSRDFVDALSKGSQSILEAENRFKSLGLALTELETTKLTAFSKAMTALGGTVEALTAKFGAGFAAGFTTQLEAINKALENSSSAFVKAGEVVATYMAQFAKRGFLAPFTAAIELMLKELGKVSDGAKEAEKSATDMGDGLLRSSKAPLRAADDLVKKLDEVKRKQEELSRTAAPTAPTAPEPTWMGTGRDPTGRTPHWDMTKLGQDAEQAFQKVDQAAQNSAQQVQQAFSGIDLTQSVTMDWSNITTGAQTAADGIRQAFTGIDLSQSTTMNWETLLANVQVVADAIRITFTIDLTSYITMDWGNIISNAFTAAESVASAFSGINIESALTSQIGSIISKLGELETAARSAASAISSIPSPGSPAPDEGEFASGGLFRGRGGRDNNLAWLSDMEFIMRPEAVRKYGVGLMRMINSMQFPGFAMGGLVGQIPAYATGGPARAQNSRVMHLTIGDQTFRNLVAPESTAKQLERAAIMRQSSSTGVEPRWQR